MISKTLPRFWIRFGRLPRAVQLRAIDAYHQFRINHLHKSLCFKRVQGTKQTIYSARIGKRWRVLGLLDGETIYWFWIGSHADYDQILSQI